MNRYEIIIYWSNEDNAFIAEVPELAGCMAHGNSYEEALANAKEAIHLWIDTAKEFGDSVPAERAEANAGVTIPARCGDAARMINRGHYT